jgi:hypothetical protein
MYQYNKLNKEDEVDMLEWLVHHEKLFKDTFFAQCNLIFELDPAINILLQLRMATR